MFPTTTNLRCCPPARHLCSALAAQEERLHYVGCGELMITADGRSIDTAVMPDLIHPGPAGYDRLFSQCWGPAIERALAVGSGSENRTRAGGEGVAPLAAA